MLKPGQAAEEFLQQDATPKTDVISNLEAKFAALEAPEKPNPEAPTPDDKPKETPPAKKPKEEPKPEDFVPEDKDQGGEWWKEIKAGEAFDRIKKEAKAAKQEAEELRTKLAQFDKVDLKEVDTLREKYTAQEKKMAAVMLEETETYQREIRQPIQKLAAKAEEIGGEDLVTILANPDKRERNQALATFLENYDTLTSRSIERLVDDLDGLLSKQTDMRKNAEAELERIRGEEKQQASKVTEQQRAAFREGVSQVFSVFERKFPAELLTDKIGQQIKEESMQTDLGNLSRESQAMAVASMNLVPRLAEAIQKRDAEIKNLKEAVAKLGGATPKPGSKPPVSPAPSSSEKRNYRDAVDAKFAELGM